MENRRKQSAHFLSEPSILFCFFSKIFFNLKVTRGLANKKMSHFKVLSKTEKKKKKSGGKTERSNDH